MRMGEECTYACMYVCMYEQNKEEEKEEEKIECLIRNAMSMILFNARRTQKI